jgi:ABC-type transport system involved in cytochrome c biogenesis permease component
MTALAALIRRDIRIALRVGGGALIGVLFFLTVTVLMPFAAGQTRTGDPLARGAAGQFADPRPPVHGRSRRRLA